MHSTFTSLRVIFPLNQDQERHTDTHQKINPLRSSCPSCSGLLQKNYIKLAHNGEDREDLIIKRSKYYSCFLTHYYIEQLWGGKEVREGKEKGKEEGKEERGKERKESENVKG